MDAKNIKKYSTRKKIIGMPEIMIGRQGKKRLRKCKTRGGLEDNIIREKKLETIMLYDKVLTAKYHKEE